MEMQSFQLHFFQSRKVGTSFLNIQMSLVLIINFFTANKRQRKRPEYQCFVRQLYHMCLAQIFTPLRSGMTEPEVICCPDGHFRRAIYSLGPYIADYPEQVWLAGIVQGWCPKYVATFLFVDLKSLIFRCEANPKNLDANLTETRRQRHERTDSIIKYFNPGIGWEKYGIRSDVMVSSLVLSMTVFQS